MASDKRNDGNEGETNFANHDRLAAEFEKTAQPIVTVDVEKYQAWLDGANLSAKQKEEFLQALWSIVVMFVDLGFGVHPLQEVCGQDSADEDQLESNPESSVQSDSFDEHEKA